MNRRLTTAQAIVEFLKQQYVERDGRQQQFFAGCFGIFGHGNVTGIGQALQQNPDFRYYLSRSEQAMVHTASAFAKMNNRLRTLVCTTSIGPGATNMITGAAAATINRLPVLLLPGDIFARRNVAPVLQQLEWPSSQDISVNDCFKPVSRYWDRIQRPEQILTALPEAMRVLTSPAETGAVTLALPQDVQPQAFDYPAEFLHKRVWHVPRPRGDVEAFRVAGEHIRASGCPVVIAGGGVIYSEATEALARFAAQTGIAVAETQAGKGSLCYNHPQALGAMGVTGTPGANILAREADLVIGVGTRYSDFTTASKTAFQNPRVRFVNINVAEFDAYKHSAVPLVADARVALDELSQALQGFQVEAEYRARVSRMRAEWDEEVERIYSLRRGPPISQGEVIGVVNGVSQPRDVVVNAAGSAPGDLHKLWRTRDPKGYHLEYGYSTMGYEIAGGLGIKMADPSREVYVLVGDGSYLMMNSEIASSVMLDKKLNIVVLDNGGFGCIDRLQRSCGGASFNNLFPDGSGVDFAAHAASLGAISRKVASLAELEAALPEIRAERRTAVIVITTDPAASTNAGGAWWDVAIPEVSDRSEVAAARAAYDAARTGPQTFG